MVRASGVERVSLSWVACCALVACAAALAGCSQGDDDDAPVAAGTGGSSVLGPQGAAADPAAPPSAGLDGGVRDGGAPDASQDRFTHCAPTDDTDDSDGGVTASPYEDTCLIDESRGVFVSPQGDDDSGLGSRSRPFATLRRALAAAVAGDKRVFACEGPYAAPLQVGTERADGVELFGGLSCETFLPVAGARSLVRVTDPGPALAIGDTSDILIERFDFEHVPGDEPAAGASYTAALIDHASGIVLRDVRLHAAGGEDADDADALTERASDGRPGNDGAAACKDEPNPGAGPVSTPDCMQPNTLGASGGAGGSGLGEAGNGSWLTFSVGGIGESTQQTAWSCTPGSGVSPQPMGMSSVGNPGRGAVGFGALVGARFTGFSGQPGGDGGPGIGGAGGGGARAPLVCAGLATPSGASGGGGGSGGCGGKGGRGGPPGGSSFGLVMVDADVHFERGAIEYGDGGDGGDGASGQPGGKGAAGGKGGSGSGGSRAACDGTHGLDGGQGGPGGGGNGGHAIGVLYVGQAPQLVDVDGEDDAAAHKGGQGGEGPPDVETTFVDQLRGSEGVSVFLKQL